MTTLFRSRRGAYLHIGRAEPRASGLLIQPGLEHQQAPERSVPIVSSSLVFSPEPVNRFGREDPL